MAAIVETIANIMSQIETIVESKILAWCGMAMFAIGLYLRIKEELEKRAVEKRTDEIGTVKKGGRTIFKSMIILMIIMLILLTLAFFANFQREQKIAKGSVFITFDERLLQYSNTNGSNLIKKELTAIEIEECCLTSVDEDLRIDTFSMSDDITIVFEEIPLGTYKLEASLDGYMPVCEEIKLEKKTLKDGAWVKRILLESGKDNVEFTIKILDSHGNLLQERICDLDINDSGERVLGMVSGEDGKLPYVFQCAIGTELELILHDKEQEYRKTVICSNQGAEWHIFFDIPEVRSDTKFDTSESVKMEESASDSLDSNRDDSKEDGKQQADGTQKNNVGTKPTNSEIIVPQNSNFSSSGGEREDEVYTVDDSEGEVVN